MKKYNETITDLFHIGLPENVFAKIYEFFFKRCDGEFKGSTYANVKT